MRDEKMQEFRKRRGKKKRETSHQNDAKDKKGGKQGRRERLNAAMKRRMK